MTLFTGPVCAGVGVDTQLVLSDVCGTLSGPSAPSSFIVYCSGSVPVHAQVGVDSLHTSHSSFDGARAGTRVWRTTLPLAAMTSPVVTVDDTVIVGAVTGSVVALSGRTGVALWKVAVSKSALLTAALDLNGGLYLADSHTLYRLSSETGAVAWRHPLDLAAGTDITVGPGLTAYAAVNHRGLAAVAAIAGNGSRLWTFAGFASPYAAWISQPTHGAVGALFSPALCLTHKRCSTVP